MPLTERIILDELRANCLTCSCDFLTYELPDLLYGDKLLRTHNGEHCAVLHCLGNPVFEDILTLVEKIAGKVDDRFRFAKIIDAVLGACCDAIDECELSAEQGPVCPYCGGSNVDIFDNDPPRTTELELPVVTFKNWLAQTDDQHKITVENRMKQI